MTYVDGLLSSLTRVRKARSLRASSWDTTGRNNDAWDVAPGETRVIADLKGPGCINHIWMTQPNGYRNVLIRMFWDDEEHPSVLCPLGDFFGLGNEIVNSYDSMLFSASTDRNNQSNTGCALNCYLQMPFNRSARVELVNEGDTPHRQYFYIDYEQYSDPYADDIAYFHAQFHRENPCDGWGHEIRVNTPEANIINAERLAWDNNYLILSAEGTGHYIGCNLSITNFQGTWWGEGDDMIWVDGYKWPPDLHGTGSEDYLNQAWGMQENAFAHNGSSIYENNTDGYQTSYVYHLENPVRFEKEIRVTIEHGHGNHLSNETSSVAYWYQIEPHAPFGILPVAQRKPVLKDESGAWQIEASAQTPSAEIVRNDEMKQMKQKWSERE
jgi:hypothetical protein